MIERQELHCHDCNQYVQFDMDMSLNGNHVLNCPNCGHEHCRVVKDGIITSERWDQRNGAGTVRVNVATTTNTTVSTWDTSSSGTGNTATVGVPTFLYQSWMNTTTGA
ncbi:MAG: hypothetical protein KAR06_03270 [Deltaproteobacteria bacterium]|nr:hypothetical protein [Deltaproteobacteria bacterium]